MLSLFVSMVALTGAAEEPKLQRLPEFQPAVVQSEDIDDGWQRCLKKVGADVGIIRARVLIDGSGRVERFSQIQGSAGCLTKLVRKSGNSWSYTPATFQLAPVGQVRNIMIAFDPASATYDIRETSEPQMRAAIQIGQSPTSAGGAQQRSKRPGPVMWEHCISRDDYFAEVTVKYDITAAGKTENIRVVKSDDECLNESAVDRVMRRRVDPNDINADNQKDNETVLTYQSG